jgi:hypothetical protein
MATCGINVNLNNLQGELQTRISGFLDLKGSLGTAAGLDALAAKLPTGLASIKAQVTSMVPEIPNVSGFLSLRSELASLSIMSIGTPAALSKLASISSNFGGLTSLSGFANINLNDLASSAFSLSGSFDPCSIDIPNIVMDPSGVLESLPAEPPDIGATIAAAKISLPDRVIVDDLKEATKDNIEITEDLEPDEVVSVIETNVSPVISPSVGAVRKTVEGEVKILTSEEYWAQATSEQRKNILREDKHHVTADGRLVWTYSQIRSRKLKKIDSERKEALQEFKQSSGLTKGTLLKAFRKGIRDGSITYYGSRVKRGLIGVDDLEEV